MWHGRSAKQRVWLGPGRYRGRCWDSVTNSDAESYANTNSYTCCMRGGITNTYALNNANANPDSDAYSNRDSDSDCNADGDTYTHAYRSSSPDTAAASDRGASPVMRLICTSLYREQLAQ